MRKIFGPILLGLGGFLLVAAILGIAWAPGVVKKTPLENDKTTYLSGEAARLDTSTGDFEKKPIYAISDTKSDTDASNDDTVYFVNTSCAVFSSGGPVECVDGQDPNLITAAIDVFATDRVTGLALSKDLKGDATSHSGLVNKWPFGAEQKTYPYWDTTTSTAVDAVFDRTETVDGLETYVYQVNIDEAPIEIGEGIDGTYTDDKQIFVDPVTGAIINQVDDQQRYLEDGTQVLDLQLAFTDDQISTNVGETQDNITSLDLLTKTVPVVGFVGGGLCLLAGAALVLLGRRSGSGGSGQRRGSNRPLVNA